MSKSSSISGIIFRYYNSGASDKVACLIQENGSRINVLFKGVKNEKSKKAGFLEIGNFLDIKVVEGFGLPIVSDASFRKENTNWRVDMNRVFFLEMACEIIDKTCVEEQEHLESFYCFKDFIEIGYTDLIFSISILIIKTLEEINHNDNFLDQMSKFAVSDPDDNTRIRIVKSVKFILNNSLKKSVRIDLTNNEKVFLFDILLNYFESNIKKLKSSSIVRKIL